jgi:hypothetical protein
MTKAKHRQPTKMLHPGLRFHGTPEGSEEVDDNQSSHDK